MDVRCKAGGRYEEALQVGIGGPVKLRAARGPAGGRTPRASACGCIGTGPRGAVRRRLEQEKKV